jgi:hypothetical protein
MYRYYWHIFAIRDGVVRGWDNVEHPATTAEAALLWARENKKAVFDCGDIFFVLPSADPDSYDSIPGPQAIRNNKKARLLRLEEVPQPCYVAKAVS